MVAYTMERKLKFEEMCEVVLRFRKDGFNVIDYIVSLDDKQMFICMENSTEEFKITLDDYSIRLYGFHPKEALEKYETIMDCLEIE